MTTNTWTLETVAARRATGDSLVTCGGWCASYETTGGSPVATLHLWNPTTGERDPQDRATFPTGDEAQLYALNAGRLMWYRDWQAQQAAGSAS